MPKAESPPPGATAPTAAITAVPDPAPNRELGADLPGLSEDTDWLAVGYYGLEGTGKTTNLLSMARLGRILLVNAESGAKYRALKKHGIPTENIKIWPDQGKGETLDFEGFERLYYNLKGELIDSPGSWVGVGIDSVTEVVRLLVSVERTRQYQKTLRKGGERERFFTGRDDYQTVTAQVAEKMREFRHLPCHFAFSALQRRDDDGWYGPAANPGIANDLPGFVDLLVHCQTQDLEDEGETVYLGWSQAHEKYRAKDRYGVFPKALPSPQFDRLLAYVRDDLTAETDPVLAAVRQRREAIAPKEGDSNR